MQTTPDKNEVLRSGFFLHRAGLAASPFLNIYCTDMIWVSIFSSNPQEGAQMPNYSFNINEYFFYVFSVSATIHRHNL